MAKMQQPAPCKRCGGYGDAHYLTCPRLRLPIGRFLREPSLRVRRHD